MSEAARKLNSLHLDQFERSKAVTFSRIKDMWWPSFRTGFESSGPPVMDALDGFMDSGRAKMLAMAAEYAKERHGEEDTAKLVQLQTQVLKSNTGKMFERFVGLAIAFALLELDSPYCVLPFAAPFLKHCAGLTRDEFAVSVSLGRNSLVTHIDADLCAFNPENQTGEFFMISVKSTLKDRFHPKGQIPQCAILEFAETREHVSARNAGN